MVQEIGDPERQRHADDQHQLPFGAAPTRVIGFLFDAFGRIGKQPHDQQRQRNHTENAHDRKIQQQEATVGKTHAVDAFGGADQALLADIRKAFAQPDLRHAPTDAYDAFYKADPVFRAWADTNLAQHRDADHAIVTISIKAHGQTPGDASSDQMRLIADLSEKYGYSELRISHEQNVILPHVHKSDLPTVHAALTQAGLGTANVGLLSDIIACPGMDYCALATARSIPVAQEIATHFEALKLEHEIGPLKIKISGCINACGHHHVGHIGILGLDRAGVENYQITLGGDATETAAIGEKTGPGFAYDEIVPAIERILRAYLTLRTHQEETFLDTFRRVGMEPFKVALYQTEGAQDAA